MTLLAIVAIHTAANELPKVRQVRNKVHRNVASHLLELLLEAHVLEPVVPDDPGLRPAELPGRRVDDQG